MGWSLERLYDLFPRLGERRKQEGVTLSGGEQQMLAIARALARDIKVLLLDEPYEGLAPVIVDEIEKTLMHIKSQGMTTILVEQNAVRALELADRAVIDGTPAMMKILPWRMPGAPDMRFSIRLAPAGTRAMRSRASVRPPRDS